MNKENLNKLSNIPFNARNLLVVILVFVLGFQLGQREYTLKWKNYRPDIRVSNEQPPKDVDIDFRLFWETWDLVSRKYIDKKAIDPQKMYYGAIEGMVRAIGDPYTAFLPPEAQKSTKEVLGGSFEGVGLQLGFNKDKRLVVIAPLKGTPAEKAGVMSGDLILKIDDKDATNLSLPEAVNLIRGTKGSEVNLTTYRENDSAPKEVRLIRDTIVVKSVDLVMKESKSGKKVALIHLSRFGEKTKDEWDEVVTAALNQGAQAIILDMRNNPGGFLDGAVYIASEFISKGVVVSQENGDGERISESVTRVGKLTNLPLVVLINKGSASASEIVAGAIQDTNRGKLLGETSFGKGTIQTPESLSGGTGIHITTAKWLTPNGRWIHDIGLEPEIKVEPGDDPTKDPQLERALQELD